MFNKSQVLAASIAIASISLAGCESLDRVKVDDGHAPLISGALVIHPPDWKYGANDHVQGGVEFGYERQLAEGWQRLDSGNYVMLEDTKNDVVTDYKLSGPQKLHNKARIEHGHVAFKPLLTFGPHFQLEPSLGVGYDELTITTIGQVSTPAVAPVTIEKRVEAWNANIGITPRFKFDRFTGIEARVRISEGRKSSSSLAGVALVVAPIPQLEISGGYTWRRQEIEMPDLVSNYRLQADGPMVGVRFVF